MLRVDLGYEFAGFSPIHNPDRNEIHFNLAYATNHHAGMEVMRNSEYVALSNHDMTRFKKSIEQRGGDLFGDLFDECEISGPYLRARKDHFDQAGEVLSDIISDLPPKAPSFITRVCGFGFHSLWVRIGQARRARSPQIAQASGARLQVICS